MLFRALIVSLGDSCFKYETLIRFDFGQQMTHRDRRIIQARESVVTTL